MDKIVKVWNVIDNGGKPGVSMVASRDLGVVSFLFLIHFTLLINTFSDIFYIAGQSILNSLFPGRSLNTRSSRIEGKSSSMGCRRLSRCAESVW